MAEFKRGNARIYYEEAGAGEPIIATHGLSENTTYWSLPGVTAKLAEKYLVISTDMRGHGCSVVEGEPKGYDADTIADDFGALAEELGIDRFHLMSHATGGMAAIRYAMKHSDRLLSLIATDTGSATLPMNANCGPDAIDKTYQKIDGRFNPMVKAFKGNSWDDIIKGAHAMPEPFLNRLDAHPEPEKVWKIVEEVFRLGNPDTLAEFIQYFYVDPDPRVKELRGIKCPTLVLHGEFDTMFIEPSKQLVREIPDTKHVVLEGIGHMTAIEAPERTTAEILGFLGTCQKNQHNVK